TAEGFNDDWDSLAQVSFPCIVHLANPDHYIVVSGIEPEKGYVHIFDDAGNRTRQNRDSFEKRWTGHSLHLAKDVTLISTAAATPQPHAVYKHLILDKGDIPAVGEPTEFVFPIKNIGNTDLIIEDVKVNCGCLKSEKPDTPIPPGESGVVKLFYSVEPKRGVFSQTAAVLTNDPDTPVVVLTACGFTGVEVRVEPSQVKLDKLFLGRKCAYQCFVRYTGEWNDFQVDVESSDLTGVKLLKHECVQLNEVSLPGVLQAGAAISQKALQNNRVLELTFEPIGNISEKVEGNIVLKTNVPGYEQFTLHVSGAIKSSVQAFPSVIDASNGKETRVLLVSLVDSAFRIAAVESGGAFSCDYDSGVSKNEQVLTLKNTEELATGDIFVTLEIDGDASPTILPLQLVNHVE
ncbi:MAG: DUF1573 domain-containing protein, partial [Thermoguttaceae bacterium]